MSIPFEPYIFNVKLNIHLIFEYLAYFIAFRYYIYLKKKQKDSISKSNRLSIILGAIVGGFIGSRCIGFLENPHLITDADSLLHIMNTKTIMGGLFGGLLGVELVKLFINEKQSSGDLFTLPIIIGIFIGRIGCFLSGTNEFTYGKVTTFFMGMDLGDGLLRHPVSLYELVFLCLLFFALKSLKIESNDGLIFKIFMISYFSFRFLIEFIKPNSFFIVHLSSIQWLSLICLLYYHKTILILFKNASKKIHLL